MADQSVEGLADWLRLYASQSVVGRPKLLGWADAVEALASTERGERVQPSGVEATAQGYLQDLVTALDGAFISSWQSTAKWQKELDAARSYLEGKC